MWFRQDGGDLVGGPLGDQPEVAVAGMQMLEFKFFHDASHLPGCQSDAVAEADDNLAGSDIMSFFQSVGFPVISKDQLSSRVGCLETPVVPVAFVDLFALKPVAETTVE